MIRRWALAAAVVLLAAVVPLVSTPAASAANGFYVSGGRLYDANGSEFVMRGVNHAHTWFPDRTPQALQDVKALGANTVRVVLSTGNRWTWTSTSAVAAIVSRCKADKLVCVLEAHDTTGYGEQAGAIDLNTAVDYWIGVKSALVGQEKYVIINIGNEPHGNNTAGNWAGDTRNAISRLRSNGFTHTLMATAPNWGQDWSNTMRNNASSVFDSDPQRNTVFDVHMYGVYDTSAEVYSYLDSFVNARLPIVVGEFGHWHSDGAVDEGAIMAAAQSRRLGYLAWSWSGNSSDVGYLDMANGFNRSSLTWWGDHVFTSSQNSIRNTSRQATVY